ncbi:hypothetical protein BB561_004077 [Smittium simulii]|uniref:ATP synthase subunit K, mitochondrial n=1 Tax=Smittium simulii TaxID=133385 RepID=A0A2T9YI32_9FUNG|nr:hypothetical protein BB561_004077 [Smittium simulii]
MVNYYTIAGKNIPTYKIAMGLLGTYVGLGYLALRPGKKDLSAPPPINASSDEEAKFIQEFIREAEANDAAANKH